MAGKWFLIALIVMAVVATMADDVTHVVEERTGWTIPSSSTFYSQWASTQTFTVGDTLVTNNIHNVIDVPKASHDSCSSTNMIASVLTTSTAIVTITNPGNHYYICGVNGHCNLG